MKEKQYCNHIKPSCKANLSIETILDIYKNNSKKSVITLAEGGFYNKVDCSVVAPFFRAGKIGWLLLESLCRQSNVNFPWELIIIEENFDSPFGLENIVAYTKRLSYIHCARIIYISLSKWIPLSSKWYFLIQESSPTSQSILFNSADCYCPPNRLRKQHDILSKTDFNWYKITTNIVYDISSKLHLKRHLTDPDRNDTVNRACTRKIAITLPLQNVKKSVDGWMYNTFEHLNTLKIYFDTEDSNIGNKAINVNGLNNLSLNRYKRIISNKPEPPLFKCCNSIENHVPIDIAKKLYACKQELNSHVKLRNKSSINILTA